jgi:predicted ABC-type transport system involved in lysophospholipase L1 biosynthesis ATPase subunit
MMNANESPLRVGPVLRTRGLEKEYGRGTGLVRALDGVELAVTAGETLAVMGPSGCGKSTLLHLLGGLERPSAGEVWLDGGRIDELSEKALARLRRHAIGFVFQAFHLMDELTATENVELPALLAGSSPRAARRRAAELLEQVGLSDRARHLPAAQVLHALAGAILGIPGGIALAEAVDDDPVTIPGVWQLLAVVLGSALVTAALTAIPARFAARRSAGEILQAELA